MIDGDTTVGLPTRVRLINLGFGVSYFGVGLVVPVNAIYLSTEVGTPTSVVALFYVLLPLGGLVGGWTAGHVVDLVGSRRVAVVAFALQGAGWLAVPLLPGALVLLAAVSAGLGTGAAATTLRTALALHCSAAQRPRAFAVRSVAVNVGAAGGAVLLAVLAASLDATPFVALYVACGLLYWIFGALVSVLLTEARSAAAASPSSAPVTGSTWALPGVPAAVIGHALTVAFGLALTTTTLPLIFERLLSQGIAVVGLLIAFSTVVAVVAQLPVEKAVRGLAVPTIFALQTATWVIAWLAGMAAASCAGNARTAWLGLAMALFSVGVCVYSCVFQPTLSARVPGERLGRVNGLVSVGYNAGTVLGSAGLVALLGFMQDAGVVFAVLAVGVLAAGLSLQAFARQTAPRAAA